MPDPKQIRFLSEIHRQSPVPTALLDGEFGVVWANDEALRRYPTLSYPAGLSLILPTGQMQALHAAAEAGEAFFSFPFGGQLALTACFSRVEDGFLMQLAAEQPREISPYRMTGMSAMITALNTQLRAPLSGILASVGALSQPYYINADPERVRDLTDQINESSYRLLRFAMDYTAYLQYVSGLEPPKLEPLDLTALLEHLAGAARRMTVSVGIGLKATLPEHPVLISGDSQRLLHALLHLLSNSCRFTREENEIAIALTDDGQNAVVTLSDRGLGIPSELIGRVCEPFFSYDHEGMPFAGAGLGLTIARYLIAQHGGALAITSQEGVGTTVAVRLPLLTDDAADALRNPPSELDLLRDRFSLLHVILSDSCGVPAP